MLRLILNVLLALVATRFLVGLFRWMGGHPEESGRSPRTDRAPDGGTGGASGAGATGRHRPTVDKSQVIDVAFTEEGPDAGAGATPGAPAGSAAGGPESEAR